MLWTIGYCHYYFVLGSLSLVLRYVYFEEGRMKACAVLLIAATVCLGFAAARPSRQGEFHKTSNSTVPNPSKLQTACTNNYLASY